MIKTQCEQCKKYNSSCTENVVFNGQSCEQYSKKINLDKETDAAIETEKVINNGIKYPDPNERIHGWLAFLLFSIGCGGLFSALAPLFTYDVNKYAGSYFLAMSDVVLGIMVLALAGYTIWSFLKRKPNAVFLGKLYIVIIFLTNLISLVSGGYEESPWSDETRVIRSLIWSGIWFLYLVFSNQVEDIIPKSYRKIFNRDYYFTAAFIIVPALILAIGIGEIKYINHKKEAVFISSSNLSYNQYTDGRIIFTKPNGFTCEKMDLGSIDYTVYSLEHGDDAWITICSDYDTDKSASNFNSYWENWKDENFEGYTYHEILNEKRTINGNPYYIKSVMYNTMTPIIWRYVLLFNDITGKVCIISYYQLGNEQNYLYELLNTVNF